MIQYLFQQGNVYINIYSWNLKKQYLLLLSKTELVEKLKLLKFSYVKELEIKNYKKTQNLWLQLF